MLEATITLPRPLNPAIQCLTRMTASSLASHIPQLQTQHGQHVHFQQLKKSTLMHVQRQAVATVILMSRSVLMIYQAWHIMLRLSSCT
jgi:hypothetical protein